MNILLDTKARVLINKPVNVLANLAKTLQLKPDQISLLSFGVGILAGIFLSFKYDKTALIFLWASGLLDVVDGQLARNTNTSSKSGAFLDMILDRMVESMFVLGMVIANQELAIPVVVFLISVIFNFSTFLSAGALFANTGIKSMHYDNGLIERTETFVFLSLSVVLVSFRGQIIWLLNSLIFITGIIRFVKIYFLLKRSENNNEYEVAN